MTKLHTMTLHGDRVAYRDEGAGEVMLLIHGVGGSSHSWRELVPMLSTKYRVIAPDLLGHGQSDKPRGDYSLGAFAVWLRDFLDALGISKARSSATPSAAASLSSSLTSTKEYTRRLVLVSSGGLGADLGRLLRVMSLPGAELALRLIASRPAVRPPARYGRACPPPARSPGTARHSEHMRRCPTVTTARPSCVRCGPSSTTAARRSAPSIGCMWICRR